MTADAYMDTVMRYATGWHDATGLRLLIGAFGAIVLLLCVISLFKRNSTVIAVLLWMLLGSGLVVFSVIPEDVIKFIISTEYMVRIRTIMGVVSIVVLLITFEAIRRTHLQERYAILWLTTGIVMLGCVVFPDAVALFRAVTGMEYGAAMASVAFIFLAMVAFHFSISFSAIQSRQSKIAQRLAILEERLRKIEDGAKNPGENSKGQKA